MIEGLKEMFESSARITELERNQEKFEKIMIETMEGIEAMGLAYNTGKEILDNSAIGKSLTSEKHVQIATQLALEKITYADLQKVNEAYNNLRKMYKEFFKKDAVSAKSASTIIPEEVNFKPADDKSPLIQPYWSNSPPKQISP